MLTLSIAAALTVSVEMSVGPPEPSEAQTSAPAPICTPGAAGSAMPRTLAQWAEGARLFDGLGDFHRPAKRYTSAAALDPATAGPLLTAYAAAMKAVARQYPDDPDIQVMAAEAAMTSNAWKLWSLDGNAAPGTEDTVSTLELVLSKLP